MDQNNIIVANNEIFKAQGKSEEEKEKKTKDRKSAQE